MLQSDVSGWKMRYQMNERILCKRITELEEALENLMDDYQYNVCYDRHYEKARKVLKQGIIDQMNGISVEGINTNKKDTL